ncbi:MAG: AI-2E family transporter [Planctomycetota bacterium]|nr:AI-2E family transporter [Planctomycetota bacterium]
MDRIIPQRFLKPMTYGVVAIVAITLMITLRSIFAPLLAGFFIAYILDPFADALERKGIKRIPAVILIFTIATVILLGSVLAGSVALARGGSTLVRKLAGDTPLGTDQATTPGALQDPDSGIWFIDQDADGAYDPGWVREAEGILERDFPGAAIGFKRWKDRVARRFGDNTEEDPNEALARRVEATLDATLGRAIEAYLGPAQDSGSAAGSTALTGQELADAFGKINSDEPNRPGALDRLLALGNWILLLPVYVFFFLIEIDPMITRIRGWIPSALRPRSDKIATEVHGILSSFFRGRLLICIVKGSLTGIGLMFTGVPYGFLIGFAAGFLSLIPYLGVLLAAIPALGMCWFENHDLMLVLATGVVFAGVEVLDGLVLVPRFLGSEVGLHPVTVIVTFLIFTHWFGVIGMLLSVPMAAVTKTLAREFLLPLWLDESSDEPPDPKPSGA